jgi:hypothetical protein
MRMGGADVGKFAHWCAKCRECCELQRPFSGALACGVGPCVVYLAEGRITLEAGCCRSKNC